MPVGESIQLYNALKILGKPVEFITVDGENHFISDYPKRELCTTPLWRGLHVGCRIARRGGMSSTRKDIGRVMK